MTESKQTVKEAVLQALATRPNRSAKEIHNEIKKNNLSAAPTYQAVHKTLQFLAESGSVLKTGGAYSLSPAKVQELEKQAFQAKRAQQNPGSLAWLSEGQSATLEFNGPIIHTYYWLLDAMIEAQDRLGPSKRILFFMNGLWPASTLGEREHALLSRLARESRIDIFAYNLPSRVKSARWDAFFKPLWSALGARVHVVNDQRQSLYIDTVVFHDYVIQIEQPPSVKRNMLLLSKLPLNQVLSKFHPYIFNTNAKITFHAYRSPALAAHYYAQKT